jgi:hypothetical protein
MFRKRALTGLAAYNFINTSVGNRLLTRAAAASGMEREEFYVNMSRGFKPGEEFITRFRFNPNSSLLTFIHIRLSEFDYKLFDSDMAKYTVSLI